MDFTPYELRHLAAHLVAAERYFDLHRLLTWQTGEPGKNTWYEACAEAGEIAGYLGDVRRGWDAAAARLGADPVECLALQARYALMTATMGSLASAVPPSLMAELVRTGVWTVEQAVEAARRVPDSEQQVEALMGVSTVAGLPQQEIDRLWQESIAAAEAIADDYLRAGVLARLSVTLPVSLQARIYRAPRPSPEEIEVRYATGATPSHDSATSDEHLEARMVRDLIDDLTHGTPDALDHAFQVAMGLTGELQRTLAFAQVVPRLVEQGRRADAEAAVARLTATDRATQGRQRVRAARAVHGQASADVARDAPRWQAELLADEVAGSADPAAAAGRALAVSTQVADDELVDELVASGARLMAEAGSVDEAVAETATLRSRRRLAEILTVLAAAASPTQASAVEALAAQLDDAREWAGVLLALPSATADEATRRRELVSERRKEIRDPASRAELAALLASRSAGPDRNVLVREAVSCVGDVVDANARARVMALVLRHAPEAAGLMDVHVHGVHASHDALAREAFATALARQGQPDEAVALLSGIVDGPWRDCAAYSVAVRLASDGHVAQALELAAALSGPFLTAELIRSLSATPTREVVPGVWELVDAIADPVRRAMALTEALRVESAAPSRAHGLTALKRSLAAGEDRRVVIPLLAAARLGVPVDELRQCVGSLRDESVRVVALAGLALHTGADEPLRALDPLPQVDRLAADLLLADCVDGAQLIIVLDDAVGTLSAAAGDRRLRQRLVAAVRPGLGLADSSVTHLWSSSLDVAGRQVRPDALGTVQSLHGVALTLGGAALVSAVGSATRQVAQWWP